MFPLLLLLFRLNEGPNGSPMTAPVAPQDSPCKERTSGHGVLVCDVDCSKSGPCISPDLLEKAVRLHVEARRASQPAGCNVCSSVTLKPTRNTQTSFTAQASSATRSIVTTATELGSAASHFSVKTIECTTFSDPALRRGSKVSHVLHRFGAVLASSAGSADTFALSEPVLGLSVFISHNWSTQRWSKFLALALYFNLNHAFLVTFVAVSAVMALVMLDCLPLMNTSPKVFIYHKMGPYCTITSCVAPMTSLVCGHELMCLLKYFGMRQPHVFLDKTCIHQTDGALQRAGIQSLSAYLNVSDEMVIVYTNSYLKRLWTVYELASVLMMKEEPRITVVTIRLMWVTYVWFTILTIYVVLQIYLGSRMLQDFAKSIGPVLVYTLRYGVAFPLMIPYIRQLRIWAKERRDMHTAARAFSIRSAVCCVDDDRKTVQENVSSFMRDFGFVHQTATVDQALDAFDVITRELVPLHLDASFGAVGLPYRHALVMVLPWAGWGFDAFAANATRGFSARVHLAQALYYGGMAFVVFPFWFSMALALCSRYLGLSKVKEVTYLVAAGVLLLFALALFSSAYNVLFFLSVEGETWSWLTAYALVNAAGGAAVAYIYKPQRVLAEAHRNCKATTSALFSSCDLPKT